MRFGSRPTPTRLRHAAGGLVPLVVWLLLGCGAEKSRDPDPEASPGGRGGSGGASVAEGGAGRGTALPLCSNPPVGWSTGVWATPYCAPASVSGLGTLTRVSSSVWTITLEDAVGTGCTGSRIDVSVDGPVQPAFSEGGQLMVELAGYDGSLDQLNLLLLLRDMRGSLVFGAFSHAVEQWVGLGAAAALGFDARFEERCEVSDPGCNEAVVQYDAIVSDDEGEQRLQPSQRAPLKIQGVVYELDYYGSTDFRGLTRTTCFPLTTGQFASFALVRSAAQ